MSGTDCTFVSSSSGKAVPGSSCSSSTCLNTKEVTSTSAPTADFKTSKTIITLGGFTVDNYNELTTKARDAMIEAIKRAFSIRVFGQYPPPSGKRLTVRIAQGETVTNQVQSGGGPRLSSHTGLQAVVEVTALAAEADAVASTVAAAFATPAATAAVILPAIIEGVAAVPADEGGAYAQTLAASLSISEGVVTSTPVDLVTRSYTKKEVRRLNKKCKNKKSWCDLVTLSGSKSKCQSFCMGGKCTAARKVKKSCKARCKKRCQAFVQSPYFGTR